MRNKFSEQEKKKSRVDKKPALVYWFFHNKKKKDALKSVSCWNYLKIKKSLNDRDFVFISIDELWVLASEA